MTITEFGPLTAEQKEKWKEVILTPFEAQLLAEILSTPDEESADED